MYDHLHTVSCSYHILSLICNAKVSWRIFPQELPHLPHHLRGLKAWSFRNGWHKLPPSKVAFSERPRGTGHGGSFGGWSRPSEAGSSRPEVSEGADWSSPLRLDPGTPGPMDRCCDGIPSRPDGPSSSFDGPTRP